MKNSMTRARIVQLDKNPMQSGRGRHMASWSLVFTPATPYFIDPLMGWTGMDDTTREITLTFPSAEAAVAYAKKNNLQYEVVLPQPRKTRPRLYADNFRFRPAG